MTIIAAEKKRRDEKTARLRAQREAAETGNGPRERRLLPAAANGARLDPIPDNLHPSELFWLKMRANVAPP